MSLLEHYQSPADLKKFSLTDLTGLAKEIREVIIGTVAKNGGHLAPSLGAVELTIALHAVLDTPRDLIVWDVGHQAYAHKILTGRYQKFSTLRKFKGVSGFPKREESPYDAFTVGHASTSLSAALGMAKARDIQNENYSVFAVIGDGSLSGGMALAALNNIPCVENKNFTVILNDNNMSISKPVGRLSTVITRLRISPLYTALKKKTENMLKLLPVVGKPLTKMIERIVDRTGEIVIKELNKKEYAGFFQDLGFTYMGPVDGHNIPMLMGAIRYAKKFDKGPLLLHILTKKGKGYSFAEENPTKFHGVGRFDPASGELTSTGQGRGYTKIFSETIVDLARQDQRICAITAAMTDGTGLEKFANEFKNRFFDVGIAEEHAVTFAAGLATKNLKPVVAIYSTFLQRGYDQIVHDVALPKLPVFFVLDRGGLVGEDGPTHHGCFDLSYLRAIPNLVIGAPQDGNELKDLLLTGLMSDRPFALRYPRGEAQFLGKERAAQMLTIGQAAIVFGSLPAEIVVWAVGSMVIPASAAAQQSTKKVCVINARFVKPLDLNLLAQSAKGAQKIITIEENVKKGGFGSGILEALQELKIILPVELLGIPDQFVEQGTREELLRECGLTVENIRLLL